VYCTRVQTNAQRLLRELSGPRPLRRVVAGIRKPASLPNYRDLEGLQPQLLRPHRMPAPCLVFEFHRCPFHGMSPDIEKYTSVTGPFSNRYIYLALRIVTHYCSVCIVGGCHQSSFKIYPKISGNVRIACADEIKKPSVEMTPTPDGVEVGEVLTFQIQPP